MNNKPYKIISIDYKKQHITVEFDYNGRRHIETKCDIPLYDVEIQELKFGKDGKPVISEVTGKQEFKVVTVPARENIHNLLMQYYSSLIAGWDLEEKRKPLDLNDLIKK